MKNPTYKILFVLVIIALIVGFFIFDLGRFLTLDYLKGQQETFDHYYQHNRLTTLLLYFLIYILVTALSLPGATVMTLAGGALFGFWTAFVVVSFASSIGATLAFLVSRFLLRDWVQRKFGDKLQAINRGVEKEGAFYLFSLRLVPIFPFFVINLVMGLTPLKTLLYYAVSQIGMLPGTAVYVNAGTQLGQLQSASGILSPGLLLSFALLGVFPLVAKRVLGFFQARKVYRGYVKPKAFDYNLIVIGAGSAGLVSSYIAAAVKSKVALIEKHKMGGDCLNTGCVPSKALIRSAKMLSYARRAREFGFEKTEVEFNFAEVMERVQRKIAEIEPHDSVERYSDLGVEVLLGEARIISPWAVAVEGRTLTTRSIIIATGASPLIPPVKGLEQVDYLTSDNLWELRALPQKLVILGGGPIGCEMTQAFARLGSEVTQIEMGPRIMPREDPEVSSFIEEKFQSEGIRVLTGHQAVEIRQNNECRWLFCRNGEGDVRIEFDRLLIAVGRKANTTGFGLEELGVEIASQGTLSTDPFLRTRFPNIFAAGDVAGPYQFTHTSAHQAWYASVNALFGQFKAFKVDYRVIPWCTFTDVEVARVGLNESEAQKNSIPYEVTRYGIDDLDRAIADSANEGWVKVLTQPGTDKILGVTIVGHHAGDLLAEYVLAMKYKLGLNKILGTIHIYPTLAEMNKYAAGEWKRAHAPEKLLRWIEKYHAWRRG
ncbi:MAG: FAD-dependent oxidoreductase [Desulfuromonadales bacterium]|nr:FAD-dependent oxidoreductase [Desulfuromonadales bacterium]MBN2791610.1 FAD-dependent oxidoreductase [Desulfuromonadales bacterium]